MKKISLFHVELKLERLERPLTLNIHKLYISVYCMFHFKHSNETLRSEWTDAQKLS